MKPCVNRNRTIVLFLVAILAHANALAQPGPGWLNARDYGASGSKFQTKAATHAGSNQITVADVGDFKIGQGVMVSRCNARYTDCSLWGPRKKYAASQPLKDVVEMRGYDGSAGSWVVYVLDVDPAHPTVFRWTDDLGRTWHPGVPITYGWQPLAGGTEVRFRKFAWQDGYTVVIVGRDQLVTTIESVEGNVLTLKDPANRTVADAVVRHNDTVALQAAVDRAIREKKNLLVPVGNYRLSGAITVRNAPAITIEGQSAVDTVLDLSEGEGSCLHLRGGTEVTVRNFSMLGHMGFDESDKAGLLRTLGGTAVWGFYFKLCNAMRIETTERVLVENCHARRMSMECFYSCGPCDAKVTAIRLTEPAVNLIVHGNLLRNCGTGIASAAASSVVGEVVDPTTFVAGRGRVPMERRQSHCYRGWNLAWFRGGKPDGLSIIASFDPETLRFKLQQPREMKVGDRFEVFTSSADWNIHDNTITGCLRPAVLDSYGSATSLFNNNVLSRGDTTGVRAAVEVHGRFQFIGNHISGFDEQGSFALAPIADPLGRAGQSLYRGNVIQGCSNVSTQTLKGLGLVSPAEPNHIIIK